MFSQVCVISSVHGAVSASGCRGEGLFACRYGRGVCLPLGVGERVCLPVGMGEGSVCLLVWGRGCVCLWVCGVCLWVQGVYHPLWTHPLDTHAPWIHTHTLGRPPPPQGLTHPPGHNSQQAGGTHRTGMLSC